MQIDELLALIKERRSIREFTDTKISNDEIKILIDAARYAPSNNNRQPWKFLIIKNNQIKSSLAEVVNSKIQLIEKTIEDDEVRTLFNDYKDYLLFFARAPILIAVLYKVSPFFLNQMCTKARPKAFDNALSSELISTSMAIQNLLLAAHSLGLGACCTTAPLLLASAEIKIILKISPPFEIAALIPIGRYTHPPEPISRKDIEKIMEFVD
jgi:nitroreductase